MGALRHAFDPARDVANRARHGVSLALAEVLFAGPYTPLTDDRFKGGETRRIAFGHVADRLSVCVYVRREGERRIFSLRKANEREAARYAHELE